MSNMVNLIIRPQGTKYRGAWSTGVPDEIRQKLRHSKVSGDPVEIEEEYLEFLSPICYSIVDEDIKVETHPESEFSEEDDNTPGELEDVPEEDESKPRKRTKKSIKG